MNVLDRMFRSLPRQVMAWTTLASVTLGAPLLAQGGSSRGTAAVEYEVVVAKNVMVPMRDGVRLATDMYRPARNGQVVDGKFPVVLFRIPYDKEAPGTVAQARFFAQHGYIYLAQDLRGRYASEGVFHPFGADLAPDGYDAVVWASKQPWSTGKVATVGGSYGGLTQLALGQVNPPGLAAQAVQWIYDNSFKVGMYTGGAFNLRRIGWIVGQAMLSQEAARDPVVYRALYEMNEDFMAWVKGFPLSLKRGASPLALVPNYEELLSGVIENNRYGPYWFSPGLNTEEHWNEYADVPVYWMGGWYDFYPLRTPVQYLTMTRLKKSPQKLIMGPWCHCAQDITYVGDGEFGPAAAVNTDSLRLLWYNQFLKGEDTGILREPPVRIFVMGGGDGHRTPEGRLYHGGQWRTETSWPPASAQNTQYYFHGDGTLSTQLPTAFPPTVYVHDPENPVPTVGGSGAFQGSYGYYQRVEKGSGPFDQRDALGVPLRLRPDVVVFQTSSLERDVEVTGPMIVKLFASSSAVNTDLTAKLVDVYPPSRDWPKGFEMILQDGIIRAAYRESLTDPTPIEPGKVYEFIIEIPPVSNLFQRGHRIRIDIASSNWPRFDINPGTMDPVWQRRRLLKTENRIYHDPDHASHVVLPVVPREGARPRD